MKPVRHVVLFSVLLSLSGVVHADGGADGLSAWPMKGPSVKGRLGLVGRLNPLPAPTKKAFGDVWGDGNFAYVGAYDPDRTTSRGVYVFDVSNPAAPVLRRRWTPLDDCNQRCLNVDAPGFITLPDMLNFQDVVAKDGIGYFADNNGSGVYIVDMRNVDSPFVLYHITDHHPARPGVSMDKFPTLGVHDLRVESIGGRSYLFIVGLQDGWDASGTPNSPYSKITEIYDVTDALDPAKIANDTNVTLVSRVPHVGWVHDVTVATHTIGGVARTFFYGSISFETSQKNQAGDDEQIGEGWLEIWEVTAPGNPVLMKRQMTGFRTHSSSPTADGRYVYLAHEKVYSERAPGAGNLEVWQTNLSVAGLTNMSRAAALEPMDLGFDRNHYPHDPWVVGNLLYTSWYKEGVQVFDIANPVKPVLRGTYRTSTDWLNKETGEIGTWGIFPLLGTNRILASDVQHGLFILSDQERPLIASATAHTVMVRADGTLWAWGKNDKGQLGQENTNVYPGPVQVRSPDNVNTEWVTADAGLDFTVAMRRDGSLWAWGNNSDGNLGNNDRSGAIQSKMVKVCNDSTQPCFGNTYVSIAVGGLHVLAIHRDGTLWSWGYNGEGALGHTDTSNRFVPTQVTATQPTSEQSDWGSIAAGSNHSLAIKTGGRLFGFGWNAFGQVGNNSTSNALLPTQETGRASSWLSVKGGQRHSIGLRKDGTLSTWGDNTWAQLGNGAVGGKTLFPQPGPAGNTWAVIASGQSHGVALKQDGSLHSWGLNQFGQMGNGSAAVGDFRPNAVREGTSSSSWLLVEAKEHNTFAVQRDGSIWAWGDNPNVLGVSSSNPVKTPTVHKGLSSNQVSISTSTLAAGSVVALTGTKRIDWGHWGRVAQSSYDRKNIAPQQIKYSFLGSILRGSGSGITSTWTDGTPTASGSANTGVQALSVNSGAIVRVPASTTPRTLVLYFALKNIGAEVEASFNSAAGSPSAKTTLSFTDSTVRYMKVTIPFTAALSAETLRVQWKVTRAGGYMSMQSATLE